MAFKPLSHLARRSTKAFAHGYAQSIAAASQSSYASTNTSFGQLNHYRFANRGPGARRDAFHTVASAAGSLARGHFSSPLHELLFDASSDALATFRQKHLQHEDRTPGQSDGEKSGNTVGTADSLDADNRTPDHMSLDGLFSRATFVQNEPLSLQNLEDIDATKQVSLVPADTSRKRGVWTSSRPEDDDDGHASHHASEGNLQAALPDKRQRLHVSDVTTDLSLPPVQLDFKTSQTESDGAQLDASDPRVKQILALEDSQAYEQIPAMFDLLRQLDVRPPACVYNALLTAVIRIAESSIQAIPRVVGIYNDMLRLGVRPETRTYSILIELLAFRAMEIARLRPMLTQYRLRFNASSQPDSDTHLFDARQTRLDHDSSLRIALRFFEEALQTSQGGAFSSEAYGNLIEACASHEQVEDMITVYAHMEDNDLLPSASLYPSMIRAFAASGDLRSAVECYNEYKRLVAHPINGQPDLVDRADSLVYAAVVGSYLRCGKTLGAQRFFDKIKTTLKPHDIVLQETCDTIVLQAFVQAQLDDGNFHGALESIEAEPISPAARDSALSLVSSNAADQGETAVASRAYSGISGALSAREASIAMLAMYVRAFNLPAARDIWASLSQVPDPDPTFIEPTLMYALALVQVGRINESLDVTRASFHRIRASSTSRLSLRSVTDLMDEGIERLAFLITEQEPNTSSRTVLSLLWAMTENGGLVRPVAERLLNNFGTQEIAALHDKDLEMVLQAQASMAQTTRAKLSAAHLDRLADLLKHALSLEIPLDSKTTELIDASLAQLEPRHLDAFSKWYAMRKKSAPVSGVTNEYESHAAGASARNQLASESYDPYAKDLDARGSSIIVNELEKANSDHSSNLSESLSRFKNIRRAGRHPRYLAYARLIGAAAKEGRQGLINDIYEMAKTDVPLQSQFPVVRHGWTSILDAMVGAYLTVGNRPLASGFHEKLLEIGATPTANTYGLYITTLKESTKSFDEASEAVRIFHRARCEGVEPTPFLYNALIGKLGKARRIDDCLRYFAEMRARGLRPTSVTYGTIVNALCRVSDERFAEDLFDEMESMPNYKARPAPFNSMMQFFLTTKRDSSKVLEYYQRMQARGVKPTMHTYNLLIQTYSTIPPLNLSAAESVLDTIRSNGQQPEASHYASLIHAKGCVLHDIQGAKRIFDQVLCNKRVRLQPCLYQAYFEALVANHCIQQTEMLVKDMTRQGVDMTPYIANTLIHGWTLDQNIVAAKAIYDSLGIAKREPSTYEAMTRGYLAAERRQDAHEVIEEMMSRGYPSAVSGKILDLLSHHVPHGPEPASAVCLIQA